MFFFSASDDLNHSPRPLTRINDYINEKPSFPSSYVPPTRNLFLKKKPRSNLFSSNFKEQFTHRKNLHRHVQDLMLFR